jgi:Mn-containing catalase
MNSVNTIDNYGDLNFSNSTIQSKNGYALNNKTTGTLTFTNDTYLASTGDPITDLTEDMAAEEKARSGYENLMKQTNDPEILAPLSFLRQREIIHYQSFAEVLKHYQEKKD